MDQPSSTESNAITLRIKFKSASLDEFINRYGVDVSPGGLFIRTKQPVEVGTTLQFDFTLADGSPLLAGLGTVAWVRESDPSRANNVPGMGLRFDKLTPESQHTHQMILSEKARKEGKALSTPYPPTAFVAPPARISPSPDDLRTATEIAAKMGQGPANLAVTRPAPSAAVKPAPFASVAPTAPAAESSGDTDEFESAGKTEISDKPLDFYLKEAAREAEDLQTAIGQPPTPEEAVPSALIEDFNTDGESLPSTKSGPPPAGYDIKDSSPTATEQEPAKPLSGERKSAGREAFTSLLDLGDSDGSVGPNAAVSSEVLDEISAGAPIEETASEKTEEVSLEPAKLLADVQAKAPEPFDLAGAPLAGDRPPSRDSVPSLKPKSSGKLIAGIALLAAAAAFGAVYLAKTKPWQQETPSQPASVAVATPAPAPAVLPSVPAPEPAKPALQEEAVAKKPVAEEAKPAVAEKTEPEKPAAEKMAADKPVAEKAEAAKPESESASSKSATKSGGKAGAKTGDEKAGEQKAGESAEVAYRLVFKSSPIGAEVLIDGEYFARTPCERRILDPKKSFAITIRREGYEPHERLLGASDNWVKKGNERVLNVTVNLKKLSAASASAVPGSTEAKPAAAAVETAKPEAKPAALSPEAAKPVAPKPEPAKPEPAKPEPAKAAPAPAEKSTAFKPVPNFEEPGKAKE